MQVSLVLKALERNDMIVRAPARGAAKSVSLTHLGLASLQAALPLAVAVQQRLFGQEGSPGGTLLSALQRAEERHRGDGH